MITCHIHINGIVQGVGFRPFVYQMAVSYNINGWVYNDSDGVHVFCKGLLSNIHHLYYAIVHHPPVNALISQHHIYPYEGNIDEGFFIKESNNQIQSSLLLTPDLAICKSCSNDVLNPLNKRYHYPFTTCVSCGPRYSIIKSLPYDREFTTMQPFVMCSSCKQEYEHNQNRRHHSQTNSCPQCSIPLHLYNKVNDVLNYKGTAIFNAINHFLKEGKIVAVKGIGGYLLLCDATNATAIKRLRQKKQRPAKPLALLYPNIQAIKADVDVSDAESAELQSAVAPIVVCKIKKNTAIKPILEWVAPGLEKLGVMLPNAPVLLLIAHYFQLPLIATSANISGSPIVFTNENALKYLSNIADYILTNDRDILIPQDDSVVQFVGNQKIVLRRSRGLAPNYYPNPFRHLTQNYLAMGAELKAAFAISNYKQVYVSQYLGNMNMVESQQSFETTLQHWQKLLQFEPQHILTDKHPNYAVTQMGNAKAQKQQITCTALQHHEAHFASVLAENGLLEFSTPIIGFIWDGTGYGNDGQIWGGETMLYQEYEIERIAHIDYFVHISGDKMTKEPKISALSCCSASGITNIFQHLYNQFSPQQINYYNQILQHSNSGLLTSSMGRLIDAVAALLQVCYVHQYESQAAMLLEALALQATNDPVAYPFQIHQNLIHWQPVFKAIVTDYENNVPTAQIANNFWFTLANMVYVQAAYFKVNHLVFGGGVFQNALLVQYIQQLKSPDYQLYFPIQLSCNDESIAFGQLALMEINSLKKQKNN